MMTSPSSKPMAVNEHSPSRGRSPSQNDSSRAIPNARLASPIPTGPPPAALSSADSGNSAETDSPLAGPSDMPTAGPGQSALADALSASLGKTPPRALSPAAKNARQQEQIPLGTEGAQSRSTQESLAPGSFHSRVNASSPKQTEDFDIVRKHLAGPSGDTPPANNVPSETAEGDGNGRGGPEPSIAPSMDEDEFSSLRLQGGDMTRAIYRRTEAESMRQRGRMQRSQSVFMPKHTEDEPTGIDYGSINQPGGFRREHVRRQYGSPAPGPATGSSTPGRPSMSTQQPSFVTRNFYEFLSLYGHFAGEDVDDDDETDDTDSEYAANQRHDDREADGQGGEDEERPLLKRPDLRRRKTEAKGPKTGVTGTVLILLKSFVGTGVLFLPRAFLNGGMVFSFITMIVVSSLSYYCFLLLTTSRLKLKASFAKMGLLTYGPIMQKLISASLVISQIGFASAYIVFTSQNLQAFILAVSKCKTYIDIRLMILMQLAIFLPLSLYRNLNNISFIVYIADVFIVLGLIYLYYFDISTLVIQGGFSDIALFNSNGWTLFIGTAIFTFEGIGLIIPIQDGMKDPAQLPRVLGGVMVIVTIIFVSAGALAYGAFGSKTETVVLLNMPQDNKFVNGVQFIYSLAILLSTPMQIFPAITIMEKGIFKRSGKYSEGIKWRKNLFRFCTVMAAAFIAWVGANDLDKFVALVGSFACIPLVYIYPPLIHQKAVATKHWQRVIDWVLCGLGSVLMVYTTVLTIMSWVGGDEEKSPGYCDRPGHP